MEAEPRPASVLQPFRWLVRAQLMSAAGDALVAIALAGSLFFTLDPSAARSRVALYLVFTMAPFAIIAPLIGPLIDRYPAGRKALIIASAAGRALLALAMLRDLDSLLLFPEAFGALVLGKTYHVAKNAAVPGLVREETELVEANSKLVLVSGIRAFLIVGPGLALSWIGSEWVLALAVVVYAVMVIPAARVSFAPSTFASVSRSSRTGARAWTIGGRMLLAGSAMTVLRAINGFSLFLVAFWLRFEEAPTWWFGVMVGLSGVGAALGAVVAPRLRHRVSEEFLVMTSLVIASVSAFGAATVTGNEVAQRLAVAGLLGCVGLASSLGKLSFDAIAQFDIPIETQGRMFARFETRFQLIWVVGGFLPVVIPTSVLSLRAGLIVVALAAAAALVMYVLGRVALARGVQTPGQRIAQWLTSGRFRVRKRASEQSDDPRREPT